MTSETLSKDDDPSLPEVNNGKKKKAKLTRRQLGILSVLCFAQFCLAASVSLQGPFYPREAEKKGATATVYGLIFGSFELAAFTSSPLYAKMVVWATPKFLIVCGLFVAGSCSVLFGFLDRSPPGAPFIGLSFACRILEGFAAAAITTASYTSLAKEFPDRVATTFSMMETFFALGLIFGPTMGGLLYEIQGFPLPFHLMGSFLLLSSVGAWFLLPAAKGEPKKSGNMTKFLADVGVLLDASGIISSLIYVGLFTATLEPYLRQFDLTAALVGVIFVISGSIYGITTPVWGVLCDRGANPKIIAIIGYVLQSASLLILGPAPFLPMQPKLWLVILSLVIGGLGIAAKIVSSFIGCLKDSLKRGFPDDITTHGMVSAVFSTSISVGAFIGPSLGGLLWDTVGFRMGTMVYFGIDVFFLFLTTVYFVWTRSRSSNDKSTTENTPLLISST